MTDMVTAIFKDRMTAEAALRDLEDIGINGDQVSLIITDETQHRNHFKIEDELQGR